MLRGFVCARPARRQVIPFVFAAPQLVSPAQLCGQPSSCDRGFSETHGNLHDAEDVLRISDIWRTHYEWTLPVAFLSEVQPPTGAFDSSNTYSMFPALVVTTLLLSQRFSGPDAEVRASIMHSFTAFFERGRSSCSSQQQRKSSLSQKERSCLRAASCCSQSKPQQANQLQDQGPCHSQISQQRPRLRLQST